MSAQQQRTGQAGQRQNFMKNKFNNNNRQNKMQFINRSGHTQKIMNGIVKVNREAVIKRNLQHMQQVTYKKRVAMDRYHSKNANGRSPMVKTSSGPFIKHETFRGSVQQRLGNTGNRQQIRQQNFNIKKPVFTHNRHQFIGGLRSDKMNRMQNVQQKMNRMQNVQQKMNRMQNVQQKRTKFRNPNGQIKTMNAAGKVVYLQPSRPANYTVRVENNKKHHAQNLNPLLQQEIKLIQNKTSRQIVAPVQQMPAVQSLPISYQEIDRLPIVATTRTLHERFSMM